MSSFLSCGLNVHTLFSVSFFQSVIQYFSKFHNALLSLLAALLSPSSYLSSALPLLSSASTLTSSHLSTHLPPPPSLQAASPLKYTACVFHLSACRVVLQSAQCVCEAPVSVYLSGFCGHIATSTEGRRDGERGEGENAI